MSSLIARCVSSSMGRETFLLSGGFIREKPICFLHLVWLLNCSSFSLSIKNLFLFLLHFPVAPALLSCFPLCAASSHLSFKVFHYLSGTCYHHVLLYFLYKHQIAWLQPSFWKKPKSWWWRDRLCFQAVRNGLWCKSFAASVWSQKA